MTDDPWTIREAVELLVPKVSYRALDFWIRYRLRPVGVRRTGRPGRPPCVYDADEVRALHAELVTYQRARARRPTDE